MYCWYLLCCKPKQDKRAVVLLENQKYEVFSPQYRKKNKKNTVIKPSLEPLFPGYIFIKLHSEASNWCAVRSTGGVRDFVRFGEYKATISDSVINQLKEDSERLSQLNINPPDLNPGDQIYISGGSLEGLEAIYKCKSGKDRVIVLLSIMENQREVEINNQFIEKKVS
ncbi:transcription/translation regulatory transformer protein RfaH [Microbulbifer epialgicus]|uniref:Transcription/translation regulatory transformer protein RfaH n=1 Tax=Microbulbifer epialgicus TaxID=393907 RepID=A0ABV4NVA6_9GAMM